MTQALSDHRSGFIAFAGRPNVGKSSLLNALLNTRLSSVSPKAQTTRHRILGINTYQHAQLVYMDLPGIHQSSQYKDLNKIINRTAFQSVNDADLLAFVIQAGKWGKEDEMVLQHLEQLNKPIIAVINKIDLYDGHAAVLPFIHELNQKASFTEIVPISVKKNLQIQYLEELFIQYLPINEPYYPEDQLTDRSSNFYVNEIIRETLFYKLQNEVPYGVEVKLVNREEAKKGLHLDIELWVAKSSYKSILLGKNGNMLKSIRLTAEKKISDFLEQNVLLHLHVKVVEDWATHASLLQQLGYEIGK